MAKIKRTQTAVEAAQPQAQGIELRDTVVPGFLAHLLGFDAKLIADHYAKEHELSKKQETAQTIKNELGGSVEDISKIEGRSCVQRFDP